jgi:hypothetical protein
MLSGFSSTQRIAGARTYNHLTDSIHADVFLVYGPSSVIAEPSLFLQLYSYPMHTFSQNILHTSDRICSLFCYWQVKIETVVLLTNPGSTHPAAAGFVERSNEAFIGELSALVMPPF